MNNKKLLKTIFAKIKKHNKIIIFGHKRPDGDCYGAQFGLQNIIKNAFPEKEVYVTGETADYVAFVGTPDIIVNKNDKTEDFYKDALSIVVDTATSERISNQSYSLGLEVIKIDHHIPIDQYGNLQWVDTSFPSCAQMIAYFSTVIKKFSITKPGAVAMYTGILTDTGRFKYRGVSELTHQMAGVLITKGVDVEELDKHLSIESLEMIRYKGFVYGNFVTTEKGFVYLKITKDIFERFNLTHESAGSIVNLLGGIEGYPVWAIFLEDGDKVRVRLRSNGPDIDKLANQFSGGGHAKASGATLQSWAEMDSFIEAVHQLL